MPLIKVDQLVINDRRTHIGIACPSDSIDESALNCNGSCLLNSIDRIVVCFSANRGTDADRHARFTYAIY